MSQRNGSILLLAAASLVLLVSLFTRGWFHDRQQVSSVTSEYGIGLWGNGYTKTCGDPIEKRFGSHCKQDNSTISFDDVSGANNTAWLLFGRLALIFGIASVLALLGALALVVKRHEQAKRWWFVPVIAVGATMFAAGMFLALQPNTAGKVGYSVFLFFPAAVAGIFGTLMVKDAVDERQQADVPGLGER